MTKTNVNKRIIIFSLSYGFKYFADNNNLQMNKSALFIIQYKNLNIAKSVDECT